MALTKRKKVVTTAVAVFVVIVLVACGFLYWQYRQNETNSQQAATDEFSRQTSQLGTDARQGAYDAAAYDRLMGEAKDDEQRRLLLIDRSVAAGVNAEYDMALQYAQEADSIKSDVDTLSLIGQVYEDRGEAAQAIEAYRRAVAHSSATAAQKDIYERKITELQARE